MFDLDSFVMQGHAKVIEHYRWLRDTAKTDVERGRFEKRIVAELEAVRRFTEQRSEIPRQARVAAM